MEYSVVAVRKRTWKTSKGETKEAWIVDYADQNGDRHIKTFVRKKDATDYAEQVGVDVRAGTHTAPSKSITLAQAGTDWLKEAERNGVGRGTLKMYRQHIEHITKRLGASKKIATLTKPDVVKFVDRMLDGEDGNKKMSRAMARKVMTSLGSMLKAAHERGNVAQNVAAKVRVKPDTRGRAKLQVGVHIPTAPEVRRMLDAATGKMRAILHVAAFAGLRSSELRGLRWQDVDLKESKVHVRQRADLYNEIGPPKSKAGARTIPVPPMVVNTLREWKLLCPKSEGDLVFPTRTGAVSDHTAFIRMLRLVLMRSGLWPRYTGMHALRHFYASWCINRKADGGLELPAKVVQTRLGHASIVMTMDRYGHLFPADDGSELAEAEQAFLRAV